MLIYYHWPQTWDWDPDGLVQCTIPGSPAKSIGEGASSLFGGRPKTVRNEKSAQRPKFSAGRPCGHPAKKLRSGPPNPGKKQAVRHGHAARTSTKKLRSEKLRADFSFPKESRKCLLLWSNP